MTPLRHVVPRPIRRAVSAWLARRHSAKLEADLAAMVARSAPIVAGPWLGEVGYELLNPYWWGHQSDDWVHSHVRYVKLADPPPAGLADMPSRYTAVKFYFNDCFPATPRNRAFVRDTLRTLASRGPVIALSTGLN